MIKINQIITKLSSRFNLDLNYFLKGGFWLTLGQLSNMLKGVIISYLFANLLSEEVYGQYVFIISMLSISLIFSLQGMGPTIIEAIARKYDGTYFEALKRISIWSLLGSIFLIITSIYMKFASRTQESFIFLILALILPIYSLSGQYISFFNGKKRFDLNIILTTIFNIISTSIIAIIIFLKLNLFWLVLGTVLTQIMIQGYFSLILVRKYLENDNIDNSNVEFGIKTSFSSAIIMLSSYADNLIIAFFLGFEELAIFTIVTLVPQQTKSLYKSFSPLILPKLANLKKIENNKIILHFFQLMIPAIILIVLYIVFGPLIFKYLYPKYSEYYIYSLMYQISFITMPIILLNRILVQKKKTKTLNKINTYTSVMVVFLSLILTITMGLLGSIIARIIYRFLSLGTYIYYFKKA
jgi:O-antigen/teichoic acid export membrane protein